METKFFQVLKPWLIQFAISWVIAVVILVPVAQISSNLNADKKIPWVEYTFEPRTVEAAENLPVDDDALLAWALPLAHGNVKIRRKTEGLDTEIVIKFQTEQEISDVPWQELGYDISSATRSGSRWTTPVFDANFTLWLQRASLVACLGYLIFGIRSWRRRTIAERMFSRSRSLWWGLGAGLIFSAVGWIVTLIPKFGGAFPHLIPWFFDFTYITYPTSIRTVFCIVGIFLVPLATELFFRQGLYASAVAHGHPRTGALVSSLLPILTVIMAPLVALVLFLAGLVNCWLFRRTGRLLAPVVCSAVATAAGFIYLLLATTGSVSISDWMSSLLKEI